MANNIHWLENKISLVAKLDYPHWDVTCLRQVENKIFNLSGEKRVYII